MAYVSQDENFKKALSLDENGKPRDIYAEVGAAIFGNKYEDNLDKFIADRASQIKVSF